MFGAILAGAVAIVSHVVVRRFVARRLRFTPVVQKRRVGMLATLGVGVAAFLVGGPLFGLLNILGFGLLPVGTATAVALGAGSGSGVWFGRKAARHQRLIED